MMVNIPKIRGCLLSISTNFNRLSTDQSEKQEADLALPNLTDRKMDLNLNLVLQSTRMNGIIIMNLIISKV